MTGEEFSEKMYKAVSGGNPLEVPEVIRKFVEEFCDKVLELVNERCTNETAHVIACVLEQIATSVRACTNDKGAEAMEEIFKLCFRTESVHVVVPKRMENY